MNFNLFNLSVLDPSQSLDVSDTQLTVSRFDSSPLAITNNDLLFKQAANSVWDSNLGGQDWLAAMGACFDLHLSDRRVASPCDGLLEYVVEAGTSAIVVDQSSASDVVDADNADAVIADKVEPKVDLHVSEIDHPLGFEVTSFICEYARYGERYGCNEEQLVVGTAWEAAIIYHEVGKFYPCVQLDVGGASIYPIVDKYLKAGGFERALDPILPTGPPRWLLLTTVPAIVKRFLEYNSSCVCIATLCADFSVSEFADGNAYGPIVCLGGTSRLELKAGKHHRAVLEVFNKPNSICLNSKIVVSYNKLATILIPHVFMPRFAGLPAGSPWRFHLQLYPGKTCSSALPSFEPYDMRKGTIACAGVPVLVVVSVNGDNSAVRIVNLCTRLSVLHKAGIAVDAGHVIFLGMLNVGVVELLCVLCSSGALILRASMIGLSNTGMYKCNLMRNTVKADRDRRGSHSEGPWVYYHRYKPFSVQGLNYGAIGVTALFDERVTIPISHRELGGTILARTAVTNVVRCLEAALF